MQRIKYLDGLRGVAALVVVIYHCISMESTFFALPKQVQSFFSIFFNGKDAVNLFFVLSGLVLAYMYTDATNEEVLQDYPNYLKKRAIRILPMYWINYFFLMVIGAIPAMMKGVYFRDLWYNHQSIFKEILLVRGDHTFYLPGWSLEIEIVVSAMIPFLLLLARHNTKLFKIVAVLALVFSYTLNGYLFTFMLGIYIAYHLSTIQSWDWTKTNWYAYRFALLPVLLFFFSARHIDSLISLKEVSLPLAEYFGITWDFFSAIVAAILIIWIIKSSFLQSLLNAPFFQWLGKISYSLYLIHWFVLFTVYRDWLLPFVADNFPYAVQSVVPTLICTLTISLLLASWLHFRIEKPLTKWLQKKFIKN